MKDSRRLQTFFELKCSKMWAQNVLQDTTSLNANLFAKYTVSHKKNRFSFFHNLLK